MYYVYILRSLKNNRYYIGQTDSLEKRTEEHNKRLNRSTKSGRPWKVIYIKKFLTRKESYKVEQKLKSIKKRILLKKIIYSGVEK